MKTILLTGATDGIGLETAKLLAQDGHTLLLHGRNPQKLAQIKKELIHINSNLKIETYLADLSKLQDTRDLATQLLDSHIKIDVIINNAGVFVVDSPLTDNGLDVRFVVNTLSPYLLTKMLVPALNKHARIINLSSAAQSAVDFDALISGTPLSHDSAYAQSKLAITMWSMELAKELGNNAIVISVNPKSFLGSKMVKEAYGREGYDLGIGADILYRAALSEEFGRKTGLYYDNDFQTFTAPHPFALNECNRSKLITCMNTILGI